jgi:regulator of protease activity HflC (stomatin/prohibitin superfamily)
MPRITLLAVFLWIESFALVAFAWVTGAWWLVPIAGTFILFASLETRGFAGLGIVGLIAANLSWAFFAKPSVSETLPVAYAVIALILGTAYAFIGILASLAKHQSAPVSVALGKFSTAIHFITAGAFLAAPYAPFSLQPVMGWFFCVLGCVLGADTFLKWISRLYTPSRHWAALPSPGAFFFFRWLGKDWRACFPKTGGDSDELSLRLPEMWMWPAIRAQLPALGLAVVFLSWFATGFHEIGAGQSGVRQNGGHWEKSPLAPGFHISLPWPAGRIHRVDTGKVHETVLGFRADPGQPILWERAHYDDEQMSLVGGGDDLLSISVPIHYRIVNPALYLRGAADTERLVRDAASRILLELTIGRDAAEVMTHAREEIRGEFHRMLQEDLDLQQTGLRVEAVFLRDVHPPVDVAPSFQEVLAAMEEKEAMLHDGESYRREYSARADGEAFQLVVNAQSAASNRLAKVHGEMSRFNFRRDAWKQSRRFFEIREGFRVFDDTLAETKKAIFDERIRSSISTQLDLRRVLNPDLIDPAPAVPQSLVPRPSGSRDAFDLDVEGFLQANQGEIPAVSSSQEDPDNLLKTKASE